MNQKIFFSNAVSEVNGKLIQMASFCKECGKVSYPVSERCFHCASENGEETPLATEGTVCAYSITRVPVGKYKPPFAGGFIDLNDGMRIFGQIRADESKIHSGMKVKVEIGTLWTEEDGTEAMGYYYVPVDGGDSK